MDDIVRQAMAKWPNVPHCYGWLALDARGAWRMRDERAQSLGLPGDKIAHAALLGFINRNYLDDGQGRWYFQNGPQRVYVDLEATPHIARTDPGRGLMLHTGEPLERPEAAWLTESGQLLLQQGRLVAMVDDRDTAEWMGLLRAGNRPVGDDLLWSWLQDDAAAPDGMTLCWLGHALPARRIARDAIAGHFGFVRQPRAAA